jgi:DNA gyrase subunit B
MLIDEKRGKRQEFKHEGGVKAFVKFLNTNKTPLFEEPIYITGTRPGLDAIEVALQYNDGYNENICSYVNNINTKEGGSHVAGFKSALTRCINNFIQNYLPQKNKETVTGDDVKEGLVAVISIKIPNPQFEGQTKTKLGNSEIKGLVESLLNERLSEYLELNPNIGKIIAQKALDAKRARDAAKRAKELVKNKSLIESGVLPGKLADCQESNPELCEIFIVEGDSAGGSAKQGRDRRIQAILPLKGKILNVEKSRDEKILTNQEIRSIYLATGLNTENGARPRYKKIIIMTDADVDGSHIRTLLLTLFYRRASELITNGYLYIAQPPLYKIRHGNKSEVYIKDETEFEDFITLRGIEKIRFYIEDTEQTKVQLKEAAKTIQRLEHYFNGMEKVDTERTTLLGLFGADIKGREDFKVEERLETVARFLKERGYKADIKRDKEHNLYSITVVNDHGTQTIDYEFCEQDDYIEAYDNYKKVKAFYERPIFIMENDQKRQIKDIKEFMRLISEKGKEGLNIQRYKGLGEMNPEQLWETTMDPEKRKLIRVTIEDAVEADQIFTVLMGNNIETRRAFIEENAMYVRNLDI